MFVMEAIGDAATNPAGSGNPFFLMTHNFADFAIDASITLDCERIGDVFPL